MNYSLDWLEQVLSNAGLKVAVQPSWKTRGHGDVGAIKGVMCHHTAGSKNGNMPSLGVVTNGHGTLSGPLAQLGLGRDGTFYVIAAGKCFHAGKGEWNNITTGNTSFIGIEAENTGLATDQPWPAVQMDAYRRGIAAILKHIGQDASWCCGHKEYALPSGRKIDPTFDMNASNHNDMVQFRNEVAAIMNGATPTPAPIPKQDNSGRPTLRRGSQSDSVKEVQKKVGFVGDDIDGRFGPATEAAVRRFQRDHGLVPDGIVGPNTWDKLDSVP